MTRYNIKGEISFRLNMRIACFLEVSVKDRNVFLEKKKHLLKYPRNKNVKSHRAFLYFTLDYITRRSTNVFTCSKMKALRNTFQNYSLRSDVILGQ